MRSKRQENMDRQAGAMNLQTVSGPLPEADADQIALAERIARHEYWEHRDIYGDPYIRHAERISTLVPIWAKPAAWLHDTIEHCGLSASQLVAAGVSGATVDAVVLMSFRGEDCGVAGGTYDEYIKTIAGARNRAGTIARRVKLATLADHAERVRRMSGADVDATVRRLERSRAVISAAMKIYGEEHSSTLSPPSKKQQIAV